MGGDLAEYTLEGFAVPTELGRVHDLLERAGTEHPELDATDLMLFETAVIEIATNVVEHGQPHGQVRWRLVLRVGAGQIQAELYDSGQEFQADLDAGMPGEEAEGGRGLPLAHALLDEIELERVSNGNHWRMARRLGRDA
jgi:serine/threonine-protein kinase RsbW